MRCVECNGKLRLKSLDEHRGKKVLICTGEGCGKVYEFEKRPFGIGWKLVKV